MPSSPSARPFQETKVSGSQDIRRLGYYDIRIRKEEGVASELVPGKAGKPAYPPNAYPPIFLTS